MHRIGIVASLLCAVHCALTPIVIGLLPTTAADWLDATPGEQGLVVGAAVLAVAVAGSGYRAHQRWSPLVLVGLGVALLMVDGMRGPPPWLPEPVLGVTGGLTMTAAQCWNSRLTLRHGPCACCAAAAGPSSGRPPPGRAGLLRSPGGRVS
jgi:MerC mercury resistance protein